MPNHIASRAAILAVGGGAALATLLLIAPECRNGPFAALDPLVDHYWYRNVREGLPLFTHWDELVGFSLAPTLVGLIGSVMAWRRSGDAHRAGWLMVCAALAGTGILSLLVMRTASAAHVMAVPGTAWLLIHAWNGARALTRPLPRIAASLACLALFPPTAGAGLGMIIAALSPTVTHLDPPPSGACVDGASTAPFAAMPPQRLFTPLDIAPHLLQRTPHAVIATGHHRNNDVMAQVIAAFVGPADAAEPRVRATGATMLVICPSAQETANFAKAPGNSLTDDLLAGHPPAWLEPVALPAGSPLRAWRVAPVAVRPGV